MSARNTMVNLFAAAATALTAGCVSYIQTQPEVFTSINKYPGGCQLPIWVPEGGKSWTPGDWIGHGDNRSCVALGPDASKINAYVVPPYGGRPVPFITIEVTGPERRDYGARDYYDRRDDRDPNRYKNLDNGRYGDPNRTCPLGRCDYRAPQNYRYAPQ